MIHLYHNLLRCGIIKAKTNLPVHTGFKHIGNIQFQGEATEGKWQLAQNDLLLQSTAGVLDLRHNAFQLIFLHHILEEVQFLLILNTVKIANGEQRRAIRTQSHNRSEVTLLQALLGGIHAEINRYLATQVHRYRVGICHKAGLPFDFIKLTANRKAECQSLFFLVDIKFWFRYFDLTHLIDELRITGRTLCRIASRCSSKDRIGFGIQHCLLQGFFQIFRKFELAGINGLVNKDIILTKDLTRHCRQAIVEPILSNLFFLQDL